MSRTINSIKDLVWGGRVRREWQGEVWNIAWSAAVTRKTTMQGSMMSSSETTSLRFLDGAVWDSRGYFGPSSGMFIQGPKVVAYILYKLGCDAAAIEGDPAPTLEELETQLSQEKAARGTAVAQ